MRLKTLLPPETRGNAAKNAPFSRNAPAPHPETSLLPKPTQRIDMEKNAFRTPPRGLCGGFSFCLRSFRRRRPFLVALCTWAGFPRPSMAASLLLADFRWRRCVSGRPFRARQRRHFFYWRPSVGGIACLGDPFAPTNGAWRLKSLRVYGIGSFFSRERRMFHVKQAGKMTCGGFCGRNSTFSYETALATFSALF